MIVRDRVVLWSRPGALPEAALADLVEAVEGQPGVACDAARRFGAARQRVVGQQEQQRAHAVLGGQLHRLDHRIKQGMP